MKDIKASNRSNKHKVTENLVNIKKTQSNGPRNLKKLQKADVDKVCLISKLNNSHQPGKR